MFLTPAIALAAPLLLSAAERRVPRLALATAAGVAALLTAQVAAARQAAASVASAGARVGRPAPPLRRAEVRRPPCRWKGAGTDARGTEPGVPGRG
jgi:hypothetical protein